MVDMVNISIVKRELMKKEENEKKLIEMKNALPKYNMQEIERYRLPYHEALCSEIKEAGYPSASQYIKYLIEFQENIREKFGVDSIMWYKPRLLNCKNELQILKTGLIAAEIAHEEDLAAECDELIKLAIYFAYEETEFLWLGEQLLNLASEVCSRYPDSRGKQEAIAKFLYAKFVKTHAGVNELVKVLIERVREISNGMSWSVRHLISGAEESIFIESTLIIYESLAAEARRLIHTDPHQSIVIARMARQRAVEACFKEGQVEALLIRCVAELQLEQKTIALEVLVKAFKLQATITPDVQYVRDMHHVFELFLSNEDERGLQLLIDIHEEVNSNFIPIEIVHIIRHIGRLYLKLGKYQLASSLFVTAFNLYSVKNDGYLEETRCFAAIAKGQGEMKNYIRIIRHCIRPEPEYSDQSLKKLITWKNRSEPLSLRKFSDTSLFSNFTQTDMLNVDAHDLFSVNESTSSNEEFDFLLTCTESDSDIVERISRSLTEI